MNNCEKIDFVITWVDGSDIEWCNQKNKYESIGDSSINRFRDWGLLKYWFRGVEKFAPWVNKVHFVTWGHIPNWLNIHHPKINIVKHSDFIPEKYLPTFNSNAIELNLHRIQGLSENFVYFNDDVFLLKETRKQDFFIDNKPCDSAILTALQPTEKLIDNIIFNNIVLINKNFDKKITKKFFSIKYGFYNIKSLCLLFFNKYSSFNNFHCHLNLKKSTMISLWNEYYEVLDSTSMSKFRTKNDVNIWLARYWQIVKGDFVASSVNDGYYEIDDINLLKEILKQKKLVVCLNDVLEYSDIDILKNKLIKHLSKILPLNLSLKLNCRYKNYG